MQRIPAGLCYLQDIYIYMSPSRAGPQNEPTTRRVVEKMEQRMLTRAECSLQGELQRKKKKKKKGRKETRKEKKRPCPQVSPPPSSGAPSITPLTAGSRRSGLLLLLGISVHRPLHPHRRLRVTVRPVHQRQHLLMLPDLEPGLLHLLDRLLAARSHLIH